MPKKTYDIHYQFSNGVIMTGLPLEKIKRVFSKLVSSCTKEDLPQFKFFQIKETGKDDYVTFCPKTGAIFGAGNIANPQSRTAIALMFQAGTKKLQNL